MAPGSTVIPAEPDKVAAAFTQLAEVLASKDFSPPQLNQSMELVTVGAGSDPALDRQIFCRDCLDVRHSMPGEPPQGGSPWGSHSTMVSGNRTTVEHPRKPKILSYDKTAVLEGLKLGTHGQRCLQCGTVLLKEAR